MRRFAVTFVFLLTVAALPAVAGQPTVFKLAIHDDGFKPSHLTIPAGERVQLKIANTRNFPAEFESFQFNREKVVPGKTTVAVWVGPLKPGKYRFFDDFNSSSVGWLIVEKPKGAGK